MGLLDEAVAAVKRDPINRYISQASFVGPRRGVAHLHALRSAFIDIDCQEKLGVAPDAAFINSVLVQAARFGIPEPTMIIRSGRGIYAKWIFERSITAAQLDKWKLVNDALLDLFKDFGADMKVRDAARVLRVLGSTNSKAISGSEVVQLEHENPTLHDFDTLCSQVAAAILVHGVSKRQEPAREARIRRERITERAKLLNEASPTDLRGLVDFEEVRRPILVDEKGRGGTGRYSSRSKEGLNWRRFIDLRNLILARGGAPKGTRDQYVFWMLNHLCLSGMVTPKNFESEALSLIHLFPRHDGFNPLADGSLSTLIKKLAASIDGQHIQFRGRHYNPLYTPTNDYLINAFEITPTEEVGMTTIISTAEKQRRQDLLCPGRAERRDRREGRAAIVKAVLQPITGQVLHKPAQSSLPIKTLADALGVSERQARRVANNCSGRHSAAQVLAGRIGLAKELLTAGDTPDAVAKHLGISRRQLQRWIPRPCIEQALLSLASPAQALLERPTNSPIEQDETKKAHTDASPSIRWQQAQTNTPAHDKPLRTCRPSFSVSMEVGGLSPDGLNSDGKSSDGGGPECFGPNTSTKPTAKPASTSWAAAKQAPCSPCRLACAAIYQEGPAAPASPDEMTRRIFPTTATATGLPHYSHGPPLSRHPATPSYATGPRVKANFWGDFNAE